MTNIPLHARIQGHSRMFACHTWYPARIPTRASAHNPKRVSAGIPARASAHIPARASARAVSIPKRIVDKRVEERVDGGVEPQQPESNFEYDIGNAVRVERRHQRANRVWQPTKGETSH